MKIELKGLPQALGANMTSQESYFLKNMKRVKKKKSNSRKILDLGANLTSTEVKKMSKFSKKKK